MTLPVLSGWFRDTTADAEKLRGTLNSLRADLSTTRGELEATEDAMDAVADSGVGAIGSDERAERRHGRESRFSEELLKFIDAASGQQGGAQSLSASARGGDERGGGPGGGSGRGGATGTSGRKESDLERESREQREALADLDPYSNRRAMEIIEAYIALQERTKERMKPFERDQAIRDKQAAQNYFRDTFGGSLDQLARELQEYRRVMEREQTRETSTGRSSGTIGNAKPRARKQTSIAILRWGGEFR